MIYLDNAATSFPKAPGVAEAVRDQILSPGGSAGRSTHAGAVGAGRLLFAAREELAFLVGCAEPERLVFTKNATEALNLAIFGAVRPGSAVVTSSFEHNAVMRPLRYLEAEKGVSLRVLSFGPDGSFDPAEFDAALAARPGFAVFTAASNASGTLLPVDQLVARCAAAGVPVCVDASQVAGHRPLDADALGADYLCFPGHKGLLGPSGTGALVLGRNARPAPLLRGGTGSASDSEEQPDFLPDRYEAGTHNLCGLAGLLAAVRYLAAEGIDGIREKEARLCARLAAGLEALPGLRLYGPAADADRAPAVSFAVDGVDTGELGAALDAAGIAARIGLHCAPAAHRSLGSFAGGGTIRLSPGCFTAEREIEKTIETIGGLIA